MTEQQVTIGRAAEQVRTILRAWGVEGDDLLRADTALDVLVAGRAEVVARVEAAADRYQEKAAANSRLLGPHAHGPIGYWQRMANELRAALADPDPAQATHDGEERVLKKVPRRPRGESRPHRAGPPPRDVDRNQSEPRP